MPVTKSAKRALRKDRRRANYNTRIKRQYKAAVKIAKDNPTAAAGKEAFSRLDRAAKKGVIAKNKASRLKSRLAKLLPKASPKTKRKSASKAK